MDELFWIDLIISLVTIHIIIVKVFNARIHIIKAVVAGLIIFSCVVLAFLLDGQFLFDVFLICGTVISYAAPLLTLKKAKKITVVYSSMLYFGVSSTFAISCRWIIRLFTIAPILEATIAMFLQCIMLAVCVVFSRNPVFHKTKQYINLFSMKIKILLLSSVWLSLSFAFFVSEFAAASPHTLYLTLAELSAAAIIISVGIMWPFFILSNSLNTSYKAEMNRLDGQMQAQSKHYEHFLQANEDLRKFRHDFDNVVSGIIGYAESGDNQAVLQLAYGCRQHTRSVHNEFKTGNFGADALFTDKQIRANEHGSQIIFNGGIPSRYVSTLDICLILGNALDNAIEACAELSGERTIKVTSDMLSGFLFINVTNPVKKDVSIRNNMIATTKDDKKNHGIGLVSISRAIEKYEGTMKLSCKDKIFSIQIELDLNPFL